MPETTAARMKQPIRKFFMLAAVLGLAACGGGGSSGGGGSGSPSVTISGKITFDRVPFKPAVGTGLNFGAPIPSPARQIVVQALDASTSAELASTTTDSAGDYSLQVPSNRNVVIRARAQMRKVGAAPTWDFQVLNNTNGDALYTLDGSAAGSGTSNSTRNLHAPTGWGSTSYTGTRAAAPFAILDTIYKVKELVLTAKADTAFPALDLYWSTQNRPSDFFCPDVGDVVSSIYTVFAAGDTDECTTPTTGRSGIYVLGNFTIGDTDEFDQHVIAHEAGHYIEDRFSRSDSIGGSHGSGDRLDLRVAFGEGWGNAFGAMVLNDPQYRDSFSGSSGDSGFNIESAVVSNPGWFSEFSIHKLLWDWFDPANEPADSVSLGFTPIYNVMTASQPFTDALTSIFPFTRVLKANNPAAGSGINALLAEHGINPITDDYGATETVFALNPNVVPIYTDVFPNTPVALCGINAYGEYNKLSNRRFLRFQSATSRSVSITVTATSGGASADPDIIVWRRGSIVALGEVTGVTEILQVPVQAGTYVIEIYDYNHIDQDTGTGGASTCMNVSIAG